MEAIAPKVGRVAEEEEVEEGVEDHPLPQEGLLTPTPNQHPH